MATMILGLFIASLEGQSRANVDGQPQFTAAVDLVPLDVCVRDVSGTFVPNLSAEDFLILENGRPQQVSFLLPSSAVVLSAVLLIDISSSMHGPKLDRAVEAAKQFATWLRPGDRLEIVAFNHRTMRLHGFGDDAAQIPKTLASSMEAALAAIGSSGSTALYDAVLVATNDLVKSRSGTWPETRDVIIVLSDGEDTSSRVAFDDVLPVVRRSGVLVYSVSLRATERGEWLGANWPMLQLARDTGARALGVPRLDALTELYREIDAELRHLYRLAYVSNDASRDGRWRTISVRVLSRQVRISARAGYYAPTPTRLTGPTSGSPVPPTP